MIQPSHTRRSTRRRTAVRILAASGMAAALVGVSEQSADAATVTSFDGSYILYQAAAGETNLLTITQPGPNTLTFRDPGATTMDVVGTSCASVDAQTITCSFPGAVQVQVQLGDGDDTAVADASTRISLYGQDGDDTLTTVRGAADLVGQGGDDTLTGDAANDAFYPGAGVNRVVGGDGADSTGTYDADAATVNTLRMGAGNDSITSGLGDDDMHGGSGYDYAVPSTDNGMPVTDDMSVSLNDVADDGRLGLGELDNVHSDIEVVTTGAGDDVIIGDEQSNLLNSSDGDDVVDGAGGKDQVYGGYGNDTLLGGAGDDRLLGEVGNDSVEGGAGDDFLEGSDAAGSDSFLGGPGVDYVAFERLDDVSVTLDNQPNDGEAGEADNVYDDVEDIVTGAGDDRIIGSPVANDLAGGAGNDTIRSRGGNDGLDGGLGRDVLGGGQGVDSISGGGNVDTIQSQDKLRLADYVACGSSVDSVNRDVNDQVAVDCELLS